jgi:hypothetical protein
MADARGDAMQAISNGLQLLDQIADETARRAGEQPVHSASARRTGRNLEIVEHGYAVEVTPDELAFNEWDAPYYEVLQNRIRQRWQQYLKYLDEEPGWKPHEAGQKKLQMNQVRDELCKDLYELVDLFESVLKMSLPDHYSHHRVCNQ